MINFEITPEEEKKFNKWNKKHKECEKVAGAVGGRVTFSFTPTGLGMIKKVSCYTCGKELDLSNAEDW